MILKIKRVRKKTSGAGRVSGTRCALIMTVIFKTVQNNQKNGCRCFGELVPLQDKAQSER